MKSTVVFLHTVCGLKPLFDGLVARFCPPVDTCHIADETLIKAILADGGMTPTVFARLRENVLAAERFGASVIQLTCSTLSPCVAELAPLVNARVLSIDEPMVEEAVTRFSRIGVMATNPATLRPSTDLVVQKAREFSRAVQVEPVLCDAAFAAFLSGNVVEHDRIVKHCLLELMRSVEVVLLAQVSMTRIVDALTADERKVPILSSPEAAVRRLAVFLEEIESQSQS
jgi:hypothetical protein